MKAFVAALCLATFVPASANDRVFLEGAFESGQIMRNTSTVDGFYIQTLPNPQLKDEGISSGEGGFGPSTNWDTRVISQEQVGSDLVKPREGNYFLRSAIHWNKDYRVINGTNLDVPRSGINFAGTGAGQAFDHDEEMWVGFSVYLPSDWEHELGVRDHRGSVMLLSLSDHTRKASVVALNIWTPKNSDESHWHVRINVNDSAVEGKAQITDWIDLGSVAPDLGKWTDFVVRLRSNPFKTDTNPAEEGIPNSRDKLYQGNRGIIQVWKADGNARDLQLKVDRVNVPVGYVPHVTRPIEVSFRVYKYGWRNNATTVSGPVWVGFDSIRYGITDRHETTFADVHPAAASAVVENPPMAPELAVD